MIPSRISRWPTRSNGEGAAIDLVPKTECISRDQRNVTRPIDGNGDSGLECDAGAYEFQPWARVTRGAVSGNKQVTWIGEYDSIGVCCCFSLADKAALAVLVDLADGHSRACSKRLWDTVACPRNSAVCHVSKVERAARSFEGPSFQGRWKGQSLKPWEDAPRAWWQGWARRMALNSGTWPGERPGPPYP